VINSIAQLTQRALPAIIKKLNMHASPAELTTKAKTAFFFSNLSPIGLPEKKYPT
jgi:hypothetical protein